MIDNFVPELRKREEAGQAVPFYLLNDVKLLRDVRKGEPVSMDDVDLSDSQPYEIYLEGLKLG